MDEISICFYLVSEIISYSWVYNSLIHGKLKFIVKPYVSKEYLFIKIIEEVDESIKADDCSIISIGVEDYDR